MIDITLLCQEDFVCLFLETTKETWLTAQEIVIL